MKIRLWYLTVFGMLVFLCLPESILADSASVGVTVPVIQAMDMRPGTFVFPEVSGSNLDKGFIEAERAATITVSSNVAWQLTIRSEDADMGEVKGDIKPLSDFLWSTSEGRGYTPISMEPRSVASGAKYADRDDVALNYKMLVGWTRDRPGTYGLTLRFTLSTLK